MSLQGISFLEVKYQLLLSYLVNLTYVMLRKSHGQNVEGEESVERLVEIRTVSMLLLPRSFLKISFVIFAPKCI